MSTHDYSLAGLNKFLDYAADKGLLKKETAGGMKRAANQVLGILEEHELQDLRNVEIDATARRFANLNGSNFKPSSMQIYVSRTKSAVQDFIAYVDNPLAFKPSINQRAVAGNGSNVGKKSKEKQPVKKVSVTTDSAPSAHTQNTHHHASVRQNPGTLTFPIPIRPDLIVSVSNIPSDLTEAEAMKIGAVIKALSGFTG